MDKQNNINKPTSHVQSVERAIIIIEALAKSRQEMSLTELSNEIGRPKSTVHGLVSTLRDYHYVDQSSITGKYKLGIHLFELGNIVGRSWDISSIAKPHMQKMSQILGETIQLATKSNGEVLYLDKIDTNKMLHIVSEIGGRLPMHCSGLGKVLLAYSTKSEVQKIINQKGMHPRTLKTIVTREELEKELQRIRKAGYAVDDQEIMDGLRCVAAPIFDSNDKVLYAISVSGLCQNMQGQHFEEIIEILTKTAKNVSYEMGYRGAAFKDIM